ncbi:glycoside hydrolase family 28 protein [Colletotrichum asianum]
MPSLLFFFSPFFRGSHFIPHIFTRPTVWPCQPKLLVAVALAVLDVLLVPPPTVTPVALQGKSNLSVDATFLQMYSAPPFVPTSFVPVAVMSWQTSLHTMLTTSAALPPVPVTSM